MAGTLGIAGKLERLELDGPLPNKVKIGISGCRMCCSESWLRDIGLIGESRGWRVIFGGNAAGRPHIGEELASGLSEDEALELIRKALHFYILAARGKERTARLLERIGIAAVRQAVSGSQGPELQRVVLSSAASSARRSTPAASPRRAAISSPPAWPTTSPRRSGRSAWPRPWNPS